MTGAAGHLVSHSGYGSLIVPGVLLKAEGKTPASWERKVLCRSAEGSEEPTTGKRRPAAAAPSLGERPCAPRPTEPLARAAPLPVSSTTPWELRSHRLSCHPSESRHSSRAGFGRKNPKGIPSQRKKAKRLFLQAEGHRARWGPRGDTPPLPRTYQIIHVQKRLTYPEIRHPAA